MSNKSNGGDRLDDHPQAYLPGDRRRALASGAQLADRVHGSALFADVSGFTALTEALATELGPQRGAEELTATLNNVFHAVIADIDRYGGQVIYFRKTRGAASNKATLHHAVPMVQNSARKMVF